MDVSDLRKRIIRALDDARKDASSRRVVVDEAAKAYESFLARHRDACHATGCARSESGGISVRRPDASRDRAPCRRRLAQTFIELGLDTSGSRAVVIGRVSLARGRQGHVIEERPIADKLVGDVTEEDLSAFLVVEIPKLIVRS